MFKKIILALALMAPVFGASAQTLKIGLVDVPAVMQAMPERAEAETKLAETSKKFEAEYANFQQEGKRLVDEYQTLLKSDEPEAIKERKAQQIEDLQNRMQQFEQTTQQTLTRTQQELMAPIIQKIRTAIEAVGKEGGYSLIQYNEPSIVYYYAAPVTDVTAAVKAKLGLK